MDIIHLLPDAVANQIAAGEVVQRPASVIKELLENSIDAGATQIQVVLREAGRELIQVIDNGKGMSSTDARMAFERHATSKITQAQDLFALHTMGFRGEALASIVAVAEVDMRTRRAEDEAGVLIRMAGSRLLSQESVVCPVGTNLEVRNLFYNVPARRNFLKSNQTELSNIITELQHVAMANPQVGFTLTHNDTQLFQLTSGNYKQRILQIFSKSLGNQLIPVSVDNELMRVEGFIGQPEGARKKGALQYFFVNDRYMRHPYFHKAVMECYKELIPEGSQPNYFIYLQVDPATIDVNVHPTKTEIKFQNESARWHIMMAAVKESLGKFNAVPTIDFDQADAPDIAPFNPLDTPPAEPQVKVNNDYNPFRKSPVMENWSSLYADFYKDRNAASPESSELGGGHASVSSQLGGAAQSSSMVHSRLSSRLGGDGQSDPFMAPASDPFFSPVAEDAPVVEPDTELFGGTTTQTSRLFGEMEKEREPQRPVDPREAIPAMDATRNTYRKYIQVGGSYIAASTKRGMLLIDQNRAHIAVLYARYFQQIQQRQGMSQHELFPEIVEVSPADMPLLEKILPQLHYLGFEVDNLGGGSFAINGKPASLDKNLDVQELFRQMIEVTREESGNISETLDRQLALRMSRAQAISSGQILSEEEMNQLVDALYELPDHTYTPDGRLIISLFSNEELATRF